MPSILLVSTNHTETPGLGMRLFTIVFERLPMVWFLLGLLFNAGGLYIGFDYAMAFAYLIIGWCCCAYGAAIYVLQRLDKPKTTKATRLSKDFISAGETVMMPPPSRSTRASSSEQASAH